MEQEVTHGTQNTVQTVMIASGKIWDLEDENAMLRADYDVLWAVVKESISEAREID